VRFVYSARDRYAWCILLMNESNTKQLFKLPHVVLYIYIYIFVLSTRGYLGERLKRVNRQANRISQFTYSFIIIIYILDTVLEPLNALSVCLITGSKTFFR
jgi:hypothetical protein